MKQVEGLSPTVRGVVIILLFFGLLVLIPRFTSKTQFSFESNAIATPSEKKTFPIDAQLQVIRDSTNGHRARGKKVTLRELLNETQGPILVNFWATWCPPCLEELPSVELLNRQLSKIKSGTLPLLITISVDDSPEDVFRLEKTLDFSPSFTVLYDRDGELARGVGSTKFPETYLISRSGEIRYKWLGPQQWLSLDALQQLLPTS